MKKVIFYTTILFLAGCKKEDSSNNCNQVITITSSSTVSMPCEATGSILITSPTGSNYSYKINNSPFQGSNQFNLLKPGSYSITVKDANNCTSNTFAFVDTVSAGNKFKSVAAVLAGYCTPYHSGNNPQAGLNGLMCVIYCSIGIE